MKPCNAIVFNTVSVEKHGVDGLLLEYIFMHI